MLPSSTPGIENMCVLYEISSTDGINRLARRIRATCQHLNQVYDLFVKHRQEILHAVDAALIKEPHVERLDITIILKKIETIPEYEAFVTKFKEIVVPRTGDKVNVEISAGVNRQEMEFYIFIKFDTVFDFNKLSIQYLRFLNSIQRNFKIKGLMIISFGHFYLHKEVETPARTRLAPYRTEPLTWIPNE